MGTPASAWRDRPTEIVEAGPSEEIFEKPRHPYTQRLLLRA
jgi:ABC-type dipeptide/oligopeptide/nickel transport system ATPase component